ncbi:hypothetical protein WJX81_006478 [Elliptochloris bilobata]|uniref:Uncharacterized protein n=1 Tax=Elliptochloris bilobata TaxID=381761 RepID=A0AAW1QNF5_9CHLO
MKGQAPARTRLSGTRRRQACVCARNGSDPGPVGKESTESLFVRELKRRGLESNQVSAAADAPPSTEANQPLTPPQLAKSRALACEGLEGLLPRAQELVKLGGSFFLGFGPLILLLVLLSAGTYAVLGNSFIHGGRSSYTPRVDPYELLAHPSTRDPMVPLR